METDPVAEVLVAEVEVSDQERCIKQLVQTVAKNAKYHSNQQKASQFIAEIAIKNIKSFN